MVFVVESPTAILPPDTEHEPVVAVSCSLGKGCRPNEIGVCSIALGKVSLFSRKTHAPLLSRVAVARSDPWNCFSHFVTKLRRKPIARCNRKILHRTLVKNSKTDFI